MAELSWVELSNALPTPLPVPGFTVIQAREMPEPYHQLLVHSRHMTVAMEEYHHCKIGVKVLQSRRPKTIGDWYVRQILLYPIGSERIVQGGIVRIHLSMLDPAVQTAILREDTPLGHVLIDHDVLRHIEVKQFLRLDAGPALCAWPTFPTDKTAYGRLGILYCDLQPAIEVFEIVPGGL